MATISEQFREKEQRLQKIGEIVSRQMTSANFKAQDAIDQIWDALHESI